MIFGDMYRYVQAQLGLQEIVYFDETLLSKAMINQGVMDLLSRTRCTVRCIDLHVVGGVSQYVVNDELIGLVDIEDGLPKVQRDSSYQPSFTMIRSDILRLTPTPSEDGEVQVWGVKKPYPMVDDDDSPGDEEHGAIPPDFQDAIITYALWKAADYADDASSAQSERYRVLYEGQDGRGGRLGQIKMLVNKRGTQRAPRRRVRLSGVADARSWIG